MFFNGHVIGDCNIPKNRILTVETLDPSRLTDLKALVERAGVVFDAVVPCGELAVPAARALSAALGLRHSEADLSILRDKKLMREALAAHGVPQPTVFAVCATEADFPEMLDFPVIAKPRDGTASLFVRKCENREELLTQLLAIGGYKVSSTSGVQFSMQMLIESVATGAEFSVEAIFENGTLVFSHVHAKALSREPHYDEVGHCTLDAAHPYRAELIEVTQCAVAALGLRNGAVHCEIRMDESGPKVIEVGGRIAGDMISDLTELVTGFSLEAALISVLASAPFEYRPRRPDIRTAGIAFHYSPEAAGICPANVQTVRQGVSQAYSGLNATSPCHVSRRQGYTIFTASTTAEAMQAIGFISQVAETSVEHVSA